MHHFDLRHCGRRGIRRHHDSVDARVRANLQNAKRRVIHALRHTCATRLLKATGNINLVKEWLGHTTIKTTADTYAHVETDSMVDGDAHSLRFAAPRL
jgi:integrase